MLSEDYDRLKSDISKNGYDSKYPVFIYQDEILDGWNRQRVCDEIGITPSYEQFIGSDFDAINFVMRSNKRRNLSTGQWAAIAVEADELVESIRGEVERERREKLIGNTNASKQETTRQKIVTSFLPTQPASPTPSIPLSDPIVDQKGRDIKPIHATP